MISIKAPNYSDDGFKNVFASTYTNYTLGTIKYYSKLSNQEAYYNILQDKEVHFKLTEIHSDYSWAMLMISLDTLKNKSKKQ